jgi:hypothetical protein
MNAALERADQAESDTSETPPILAWIEAHGSAAPAAPSATECTLDLSDSRRLRKLLKERQNLLAIARTAADQIAKIERVIKSTMGDSEDARLHGWSISYRTIRRPEHLVLASTFRRLVIKRTDGEVGR